MDQPIRKNAHLGPRSPLGWRQLGRVASLTLLTLFGPGNGFVYATTLQRWQVDPAMPQLELWLAADVTPQVSILQAPPRIVIDFPGVTVAGSQTQTYTGTIQQVRLGQFQPDRARMVIELAADTPLTQESVRLQRVASPDATGVRAASPQENRWVLSPTLTAATRADALNAPRHPSPHPQPVRAASPAENRPPTSPPITVAAGGPAAPVDDLPPAQFVPPPGSQPITVQVPSLNQVAPTATTGAASGAASFQVPTVPVPNAPPPMATPPVANAMPPAMVTPAPPAPLPPSMPPSMPGVTTVPVLPPPSVTPAPTMAPTAPLPPTAVWQPPAATPLPPPSVSASGNLIQFGQPLPTGNPSQVPLAPPQSVALQAPVSTDRLPIGRWLPLVYPGPVPLPLQNGVPHPEVLILQENLIDSRGNLFAPAGSRVLGRFESGRDGSRFITQAIEVNGTSHLLAATSLWMQGDRNVPQQKLWRNSGIAAAAGMVLTGFTGVGLLAGAAMGLAGTYAVAPHPATIQPGQVIMVQLLEPIP